jgi:hypothetical protein
MDNKQLREKAESYIDSSQKLKAATTVLKGKRDELVPAFKKLIKPDEKGNRTLDFGAAKVSLVPTRIVDEDALKAELGPEAKRFATSEVVVNNHLIRLQFGAVVAAKIEDRVKKAVRSELVKALGHPKNLSRLPNGVFRVDNGFDLDAAFASLDKPKQREVQVVTSHTLRPYPEKKSFSAKLKAALAWLYG